MSNAPNDLVPVRFYDDPLEAHLARCVLENEGIRAFVHDDNIVGLNRLFSYAVGQVKLKVPGADVHRAAQVLDESEHRPLTGDDERPVLCPRCGSADLALNVRQPRTPGAILHFIIAAAFSVYPLAMDRSRQCNHCGHIFPAPQGA